MDGAPTLQSVKMLLWCIDRVNFDIAGEGMKPACARMNHAGYFYFFRGVGIAPFWLQSERSTLAAKCATGMES
jgi:hypothetical protein